MDHNAINDIDELAIHLESLGHLPEDLDGLIHEFATALAESATDSGIKKQLSFIHDTCGIEFEEMLTVIGQYINID